MKPATNLYIIFIAVTLTSANAVVLNQLPSKLSSISLGTIPTAMPPEDMQVDTQLLSNEPVDAPPLISTTAVCSYRLLNVNPNGHNNIDIDDFAIILLKFKETK